MLNSIKNYFIFNKGERIGILTVLLIIILFFAFPYFLEIKKGDDTDEFIKFAKEIQLFESSLKSYNDSVNEMRKLDFQMMDKSIAENKLEPFPFNPNDLPAEQWSRLGLKDWQIRVIKNYESKGGKFSKNEDLKRMYCISPDEYEILKPYINIPEQKTLFTTTGTEVKEIKKKVLVELNSADSVTLLTLYGIGPAFAKRIIKYRNLLGGFYSTSQLLEVYGFDQDKLDKIVDYCSVEPGVIKKISVNKVRTDELKKHPYLDYYTAKAIVDQRIILGKYSSLQQIKEIQLIHDDLFNKLKHYLIID